MASLANGMGSLPLLKCLQFRHDCQHLGCSDRACPQCMLCQRRRCVGNFAHKYLAPCDVLEAKCGAQIYVVVLDTANGALVQTGFEDAFLQLSLVDGRKLAAEGEWEEALDRCQLLVNKQGHPLLAHGRSGAYSDESAVVVPMIAGQAMLPDLKVTDSSEALLTGRAPPFRLLARVVQRGGLPMPGVAPVLSEPFVVATARVKGAAKAEIPHVDDQIGKLEGLGVQTQKKLEDIAAAAASVGITGLQVPVNCVKQVGQFRELVEVAENNRTLRETLKQVLRLTKGWDVARDHARRAVHTDVQLRVFHPDGRTDVGLVYRCGTFNVVDINQPVGLLRRRRGEQQRPDQELVDVIWLENDVSSWPEAVRRIVPRAATAWWHESHPGWAFLPLTVAHIPPYTQNGKPATQISLYAFTLKHSPPVSGSGVPGGGGAALGGAGGAQGNGGGMPGGLPPMGGLAGLAALGLQPPGGGSGAAPMSAGLLGLGRPQNGGAAAGTGGGAGDASAAFPGAFPSVPPEVMATLGMGGGPARGSAMVPFGGGNADSLGGALGGGLGVGMGGGGDESLSPFEDPAFQQLMQMVAANQQSPSEQQQQQQQQQQRGPAPPSGESDGGKGKRKADASLDSWMAMHGSLDYDIDLPGSLRGMDTMPPLPPTNPPRPPAPGSGNSSGAGPRTVVGNLLPMGRGGSIDVPAPAGGLGAMPIGAPGSGDGAGGGSGDAGTSVPFAEFLAAVQQQRAQQRAHQMDAATASGGIPPAGAALRRPSSRSSAGGSIPDDAPAALPPRITMGQLRGMFTRAVRQEIPFSEVESFLAQHGLISPENSGTTASIGGGGGGGLSGQLEAANTMQMEAATNHGVGSGAFIPLDFGDGGDQPGLHDMRSMEDMLPAYR